MLSSLFQQGDENAKLQPNKRRNLKGMLTMFIVVAAVAELHTIYVASGTMSMILDKQKITMGPMDEQCLAALASNMPINEDGQMKAHHYDARTPKWNEQDRWKPMDLIAPCTIWYVGANTHGRDGIKLQQDYLCDIHVFEPIPLFASELQRNWENIPRSSIHEYGLGASTRVVSGLGVAGESTFAMEDSHVERGATAQIRSVIEVWREFHMPTIDLLHVNCEGCEWEMWEALLKADLMQHIHIMQVGTHWFPQIDDVERRYCRIERGMKKTHQTMFKQAFGWERWNAILPVHTPTSEIDQNGEFLVPSTRLKSAKPREADSAQLTEVAYIVQVHHKIALKLIELQLINFERFSPSFEFHIILSSGGPPPNRTVFGGKAITHSCPSSNLADCMNYAFKEVVPSITTQVVVHLNIDMFLIKPWDPLDYMRRLGNPDIVCVIEDHSSAPPYLHPGLMVMNRTSVASLSLRVQHTPLSDLGGATLPWLLKHPHLRVKPMVWSRHFTIETLHSHKLITTEIKAFIQRFVAEGEVSVNPVGGLGPDLYTRDFSWLHLREVSCWNGCSDGKMHLLHDVMPQFISNLSSTQQHAITTLNESDFDCWACATTTTGRPPRLVEGRWFSAVQQPAENTQILPTRALSIQVSAASISEEKEWMTEFYAIADKVQALVAARKPASKLSLPSLPPPSRANLNQTPLRYTLPEYHRDTSFHWRYVYNGTDPLSPEVPCQKRPGQQYWAVTYAAGEIRNRIARLHTRPSCLQHGFDQFRLFGPDDLDKEYRQRNQHILEQEHGVGLWIWKHYVQYRTLLEMNDGDILLYIDSDFRCDPSIEQYMCLAQTNDIVGFHHSNADYTLSKLASRDSMILMGLDTAAVATSVQSSGGNVIIRKTPTSIEFVREMSAWSQQEEVVGNRGSPSKFGVDWPAYEQGGYNHQCDQAVSSLMFVKHSIKTYPWHMEGHGAGSDDELNRAQRRECGLNDRAMTIHVKDDLNVSWIGASLEVDLTQIRCMETLHDVDNEFMKCVTKR